MKILIFENEFIYLDTAFKYVNEIYFDNSLEYEVHANSQDFKSFNKISDYNIVIVDISLAIKSILDGYGILKKLLELNYNSSNILIMTGNHQIKEILKDKGLNEEYKILTKPIDIFELKNALNSIINYNQSQ